MNKEEIKHFKALLRQGSLRHMNILLDDKFQKELLNIIKDYERLQQENQSLKDRIEKGIEWINDHIDVFEERNVTIYDWDSLSNPKQLLEILKGDKE